MLKPPIERGVYSHPYAIAEGCTTYAAVDSFGRQVAEATVPDFLAREAIEFLWDALDRVEPPISLPAARPTADAILVRLGGGKGGEA